MAKLKWLGDQPEYEEFVLRKWEEVSVYGVAAVADWELDEVYNRIMERVRRGEIQE